jgi:hypothetical protein
MVAPVKKAAAPTVKEEVKKTTPKQMVEAAKKGAVAAPVQKPVAKTAPKPVAKAEVQEVEDDGVVQENAADLKPKKASPFKVSANSARQISIRVLEAMEGPTELSELVAQFMAERDDIPEAKVRQHIVLTRSWLIKEKQKEIHGITGVRTGGGRGGKKLTDEEKAVRKAAKKAAKKGGDDGVTSEEEVIDTPVEEVLAEEA